MLFSTDTFNNLEGVLPCSIPISKIKQEKQYQIIKREKWGQYDDGKRRHE